MAFAFNNRGDADSCRVHFLRNRELNGSLLDRGSRYALAEEGRVAVWAARWGDTSRARVTADSIAGTTSVEGRRGQREYWRAVILAELGQREQAVRLLREARRLGAIQSQWHWADALRALHGYPPFEALVAVEK
jgi:hypothetical protein